MGLRYYSEFEQRNNRPDPAYRSVSNIRIEIEDDDFSGEPQELTLGASPLKISFSNTSDNKIEPLRGSQATMQFLASDEFHLEDMYTDQEMKFIVSIYRDSQIIWKGFVIPDGCSERFIDPPYIVNVKAIDGLGVLKNIPFVNSASSVWDLKDLIINVFSRCLSKTGLGMNINTFAKLYHENMSFTNDPFDETRVILERFANSDSIMDSASVIKALLIEFGCAITQHNGEWIIYRIKDVAKYNGEFFYYRYTESGVYLGTKEININKILGNNSGDVIHCNFDQVKAIDNAYKIVKVRYEYGQKENLIDRPASSFSGTLTIFDGWDKYGGIEATPRLLAPYAIIRPHNGSESLLKLKNHIIVSAGESYNMEVTFNAQLGGGFLVGIILYEPISAVYYSLGPNGFVSGETLYRRFANNFTDEIKKGAQSFTIPFDGELFFDILPPFWSNPPYPSTYNLLLYDLTLKLTGGDNSVISETHTVTNNGTYTTIPDEFEVHTGEPISKKYLGTMFNYNGVIPTSGWKETDQAGGFVNFLEIASKSIMQLYNRPMRIYEGSIYGYFDYFSIFTIENLSGKFMPVSLNYDFKKNQTSATLIEIDSEDLPITYGVEYEYEENKQVGGGSE